MLRHSRAPPTHTRTGAGSSMRRSPSRWARSQAMPSRALTRASSGEVWVHGPTISWGERPASCSATKSSSIQGRKMSAQPPTSWTGAVTSATSVEWSRAVQ